MENKINIAELLKDCPKGMELDCVMFENPVKYDGYGDTDNYPITILTEEGEHFYLTNEGYMYDRINSKCVIFPKGKTTWEGFTPPCKFKVGDRVKSKNCPEAGSFVIVGVKENRYSINIKNYCIEFKDQDNWELVPSKFDINDLKPFESKVLVRDNDYDEWKSSFWGHLRQKADIKYDTIRGAYRQCIPYNDDTKYLLGTTNDCDEFYKTWK